ncbi:ATP-binding protein, partial [Thermodesulfobacteriota bacterium]
ESFQRQVNHLVDGLTPDLKGESPDRAAALLNVRLTQARELESGKKSLEKQLTASMEERLIAEKKMADAKTMLNSLCREARCDLPEELEATEKQANIRRKMTDELETLENRLRDFSGGVTVAAFVSETEGVDADRITPDLERLSSEIEMLDNERTELDRTIGTEKSELNRMDGGAVAAAYAEEAERLLANLESDVERYARFKIASIILTRTIETYREKHQGPLIEQAGDLFSRMTAGSFSGLRAEYDQKGNPVLVGIRPNQNDQVTVDGMSDGSVDQLYLALRLAGLMQYLSHNEPLPFVVDDILLRFDNERSAATLKVLSELSDKTQVIFFTHHLHLKELADAHIDSSVLSHHIL